MRVPRREPVADVQVALCADATSGGLWDNELVNGNLTSRERKTQAAKAAHRRAQVRGLLWLALLVLVATVLRAGVHKVFPQRWWRVW